MIRFLKQGEPATPPTNRGWLYLDETTGHMFFKKDTGAIVDLESGGGGGSGVLSGAGAPSGGLGADGDFYIDTTSHAIYGPKTAGAWGSPTSLVGPTGPTGATGPTGPPYTPTGSRGSPIAESTITLPISGARRELLFLHGDSAPLALGGTPRIAAGTVVGQELTLIGTDDTNWLKIPDTGAGVVLNGDCILMNNSVLSLVWDGTLWLEVSRYDK